MNVPKLIADFPNGEGSIKFPANWHLLSDILRADILRDWIVDLDVAYCQARIDIRNGDASADFSLLYRHVDDAEENPTPSAIPAARSCQCAMRVKLVGDGCDVCNPEYAASVCEPEPDEIPAGDIGQAAALYQHIRTLNPREFTALWTQALTGARFDDLVGESMKARNG